jgi:N utilization substance protein A
LNDRTEAILPREERIVGETYSPNERMKFFLLDVRRTTRGPRIVVSRTHPGLLRRLLELEVPEIQEGVVEIRGIVREAGTRSKIAVATLDPNVDPVEACVGNQGEAGSSPCSRNCVENAWTSLSGTAIRCSLFGMPYRLAKISQVEPVLEQTVQYVSMCV